MREFPSTCRVDRMSVQKYQFLRAGGFRSPDSISEIVTKVDELLESIYRPQQDTIGEENSAESTEETHEENQDTHNVHRLLEEDAPFELHSFSKHFTCTLQYNSNAEYEKILSWARESSSGGIQKFAKDDLRTAEEVASDQMRELEELAEFRRRLFYPSTS